MPVEQSEKARELTQQVEAFMYEHVFPAEPVFHEQMSKAADRWTYMPVMRELRAKAKAAGLWMFPLPENLGGRGLDLIDYAPICELMNMSQIGTEVFHCYSGTISNALVLDQFGSEAIKERYLKPLVAGDARTSISITEREVPSSDPTDLKFPIKRDGNEFVLNGRKAWATGAIMKECDAILVLGCTNPDAPRHSRHSLVIVPRASKGLSFGRIDTILGFDHAPFGHVDLIFDNVRVPVENLLGAEGTGFAMMQTTLGFGRVQLGMGSVGAAERALAEMCSWVEKRIIGGKPLVERGVVIDAIARSRIEIEQARRHVLHTAWLLQTKGPKAARSEISQAKVLAPNMALQVLDRAIQFHGGAGLSFDTPLPEMFAYQRTVRIGEGADEVHRELVAKLEIAKQRETRARFGRN
ncbi:MAG TPA: acyl-CoA dehydrogenase family protein [Rhizomicrobium sp.]|nr:acyl-CoA dehydrogenase family protein [Rhizomicrobium sp.]